MVIKSEDRMKDKIIKLLNSLDKSYWYEKDGTKRYLVELYDKDIENFANKINEAMNDRKPIFEINRNYVPEEIYYPSWIKMPIDEYAKEYGVCIDEINDMISNGHIRLADL